MNGQAGTGDMAFVFSPLHLGGPANEYESGAIYWLSFPSELKCAQVSYAIPENDQQILKSRPRSEDLFLL